MGRALSPALVGKLAKFYGLTDAPAPAPSAPNGRAPASSSADSLRGFRAEISGSKGVLYLYGPIESRGWFDDVVSAAAVKRWLAGNQNLADIEVHINSPGGSVFEGIAIYQLLVQRPGRKTCIIDAVAASAASAVAMAADEILMPASSVMMVHGVSTITRGGVREHEDAIGALQASSEALREIYMARTGKTAEQVDALMSRDTWLTAKQAVEQGFADRVIPAKSVKPPLAPSAFALMYPHSDARQIAACFAVDPPDIQPEAVAEGTSAIQPASTSVAAPNPQQGMTMDVATHQAELTLIQAKLSVTDPNAALSALDALLADRALLGRVLGMAGATPLDIEGKIWAWKQAAERLPAVEQDLAAKVAKDLEREKSDLIVQARRDRKITTEAEQAWAASMSVEVLRAWVPAASPKVPTHPMIQPDANKGKGAVSLAWNGKAYGDLTNLEKDELSSESPDLFEAMRADHQRNARR